MEKRVAVAKLLEIANILDGRDMAEEADIVTRVAASLVYNPDDAASDWLDAQADEYAYQQEVLESLRQQEGDDAAGMGEDDFFAFMNSLSPEELERFLNMGEGEKPWQDQGKMS